MGAIRRAIRQWYFPAKYHVEYGFEYEAPYHDKFSYSTFDAANARMNELFDTPPSVDVDVVREQLRVRLCSYGIYLGEDGKTIPNYARVSRVSGPYPIRRLLNRLGSKRMWNIFGYRI